MKESPINNLAKKIHDQTKQYESEIREDERQKVLAELKEEGRLKPDSDS